jgi:putative ABC transport system permease protein
MVEQRTKEIGIRKVLGASIGKIFILLSREFALLVLVANLFAWPAAYIFMHNWLQNFAYRIDTGWGTFCLAGALALAIALFTVIIRAFRAATANPVDSLRYE